MITLASTTRTALTAVATLASLLPAQQADQKPVQLGIDLLQTAGFRQLKDQRVGLVTNHTGRDSQGRSTVEVLAGAAARKAGVRLVALFSPEHGFAGKLEGKVKDAVHEGTRLKIHSLYGKTRKPTRQMLAGVDTLVFEIQDVGCRLYTYISTMGLCMQACSENKKRLVVLDRPNPINGTDIGGPLLQKGKESFIGWHTIPVRHGMTVGELARMFQTEKGIDVDLDVIRLRGWKRRQWLDETGMVWVNPSPNMRCLTQATLYPGIVLLEFCKLSVGRGTDTPFERIGAPWFAHRKIAARLNAASIPGFRCVPFEFTPTASKFKGEKCRGLQLIITDRAKFDPIVLAAHLADQITREHGEQANIQRYWKLVGEPAGTRPEACLQKWAKGLASFQKRRQAFLIYE